jgi:hypothetical protein
MVCRQATVQADRDSGGGKQPAKPHATLPQPVEKGVWNLADPAKLGTFPVSGRFQTPFSTGC